MDEYPKIRMEVSKTFTLTLTENQADALCDALMECPSNLLTTPTQELRNWLLDELGRCYR